MPGWFPLVPHQRVAAGARRRLLGRFRGGIKEVLEIPLLRIDPGFGQGDVAVPGFQCFGFGLNGNSLAAQ